MTMLDVAPQRHPRAWAAVRPRAPILALAAVFLVGKASLAGAALPDIFKPDPTKATSSREAQNAAIQAIPTEALDEQARTKVSAVLSGTTVFRRMPLQVIQCDPELYLFCVRHPDAVVNIWEVLGITQLKVRQTGPDTYEVIDGAGTQCQVQFLFRSADLHLIYAEGVYEGPLFSKKVRGRGLLMLKTTHSREPDGRHFITSRLDTFLQLEPGALELFTKTFQPLIGRVADNNFIQAAGFVGSLSKTAETNAAGMGRLASKLEHVQPEVREGFAEVVRRVAERAAASAQARPPQSVARRPQEESRRQ